MCLVVAYQRMKTIENSKTVNRKSGRSHLWQVAVYERLQYKALTENIFGVLVLRNSFNPAPAGSNKSRGLSLST